MATKKKAAAAAAELAARRTEMSPLTTAVALPKSISHCRTTLFQVVVGGKEIPREIEKARIKVVFLQRNRKSPRIKASLSHAAIENLKRGGGGGAGGNSGKKRALRSRAQCRSLAVLGARTASSASSSSDEQGAATPRKNLVRHLPPRGKHHQPRIMSASTTGLTR